MSPERSTAIPTDRPEALKSFIEGREQFHSYLGNGSSGELEKASQLFEEAANSDPDFDLAVFYHALTRAELRDSDTAILKLQGLIKKDVEFLPEAYLHLAYAYTKKYRDPEFRKAEDALDQAMIEAKRVGDRALKPIIKAYRVFLYAVMGGRLRKADAQTKKKYIDKAIRLGKWNLWKRRWRREDRPSLLIKLELNNALGIAYMRKGEASKAFSEEQEGWWKVASSYFEAALELGLNPVRVHQNMGTLLKLKGEQFQRRSDPGDLEKAKEYYRAAVEEYQLSIGINPRDQFPHYALAQLYARLDQWDLAREHLTYGRQQGGAVELASWEQVERAVVLKDASILDKKTGA